MSADEVEELHVQYWRLSKLDDLENLYHEAKYSLSLLLRLFKILKDMRITEDRDIHDLIELANYGLPNLKNRQEDLLDQVTALESKKGALSTEVQRLRNSIYTNNQIISGQDKHSRDLNRKLNRSLVLLQNASKHPNYHKVMEIIGQRLNDKKLLLVARFRCCDDNIKEKSVWVELTGQFFC